MNMKRSCFVFMILLFALNSNSQSWQPLQGGIDNYGRTLFTDSLSGKLFVGGRFSHVNGNIDYGISAWNGSSWDTSYGLGNNGCLAAAYGFIRYQNELYTIGEVASSFDNQILGDFTRWNGTQWDSLNKGFSSFFGCDYDGLPWGFCEYNNLLYTIGGFDTVDNYYSPGIVAWNGTNWIQMGLPNYESYSNGSIAACSVYQNELYIAGNFADTVGNLIGCAKFDGVNWTEVGLGGGGLVFCMAVYNNELYIGGHFIGPNNANLVKFDGINFTDINFNGRVDNLKVIDNKLFAVVGSQGIFTTGNATIYDNIAVWDGTNWSDFSNDTLHGGLSDIAVFNNEIYVIGNFNSFNSVTGFNNIAKYNGWTVGENKLKEKNEISIYPNPVSSLLTIHNQSGITNYDLEIKNVLGQQVYIQQINNSKNPSIDVSHWNNGVYFYQIISNKETVRGKFVKE